MPVSPSEDMTLEPVSFSGEDMAFLIVRPIEVGVTSVCISPSKGYMSYVPVSLSGGKMSPGPVIPWKKCMALGLCVYKF